MDQRSTFIGKHFEENALRKTNFLAKTPQAILVFAILKPTEKISKAFNINEPSF